MDIIWHKEFARSWLTQGEQGRLPHAVLLAGRRGLGKRAAAAWMGSERLGIEPAALLPSYPHMTPQHPDMTWISVPEDKQAIGIEQIRELVRHLSLTSYKGGSKVAIIEPANAMTINAANSLLKTLEEPPGDTLMILVADRVGKLPATIFSRCQRIDFAPPSEPVALQWLDGVQPGATWLEALRVAGGAPLAAIDALANLDTHVAMARDMAVLGRGEGSPIEIAARWSKFDPGFVLDWLAQQIKLAILACSAGRDRADGLAIDDSVLRRMDRRNLFCYLDIINRLRGQSGGSYNVQTTFEGLLIDWADGLGHCGLAPPMDGMELMRVK